MVRQQRKILVRKRVQSVRVATPRGEAARRFTLRHEYASRLVEPGVPLAQVRDLLGHASITTTERYDNQTVANLQIAAAKLERGQMFAPPAVKVSRVFQDRSPTVQGFATARGSAAAAA